MQIQLQETESKGRAYLEDHDDNNISEMTFSKLGKHQLIIDHTAVADSMRGKGVGRKLLETIVDYSRNHDIKVIPLCPFAKSQFQKDESIHDVLKS